MPQLPQLAVFDAMSTQAVPQAVRPAVHVQVLLLQLCPVGHMVPQAPQFSSFDVVSTHASLHCVVSDGHCATHS